MIVDERITKVNIYAANVTIVLSTPMVNNKIIENEKVKCKLYTFDYILAIFAKKPTTN